MDWTTTNNRDNPDYSAGTTSTGTKVTTIRSMEMKYKACPLRWDWSKGTHCCPTDFQMKAA